MKEKCDCIGLADKAKSQKGNGKYFIRLVSNEELSVDIQFDKNGKGFLFADSYDGNNVLIEIFFCPICGIKF